jgi:hypothetical protein
VGNGGGGAKDNYLGHHPFFGYVASFGGPSWCRFTNKTKPLHQVTSFQQ